MRDYMFFGFAAAQLTAHTALAAANVTVINKRFTSGAVSDSLVDAGLLIHQFGTVSNAALRARPWTHHTHLHCPPPPPHLLAPDG